MSITIALNDEQAAYLRTTLNAAAAEGQEVEDRVLEQGREVWGNDWPDELVDAAYERARIALSILDALPPQH